MGIFNILATCQYEWPPLTNSTMESLWPTNKSFNLVSNLHSSVSYIICKNTLVIINDSIWEFSRFNLITNLLRKIIYKMWELIIESGFFCHLFWKFCHLFQILLTTLPWNLSCLQTNLLILSAFCFQVFFFFYLICKMTDKNKWYHLGIFKVSFNCKFVRVDYL